MEEGAADKAEEARAAGGQAESGDAGDLDEHSAAVTVQKTIRGASARRRTKAQGEVESLARETEADAAVAKSDAELAVQVRAVGHVGAFVRASVHRGPCAVRALRKLATVSRKALACLRGLVH